MALNVKEKIFADEYIINKGNAYQAALKAGYKEKTAKYAYEWLIQTLSNSTLKRHLPYKAELTEMIQTELDRIHSEKSADAKEVIEYLTSVLRGESESEIVVIEGTGDGCSDAIRMMKSPDEKEKLKAAELLGRILTMFTDKVNVEGTSKVVIVDDLDE